MHLRSDSQSFKNEESLQIDCFFICSPQKILVLLSASVERFSVSRMRDFFYEVVVLLGGGSVINGACPVYYKLDVEPRRSDAEVKA